MMVGMSGKTEILEHYWIEYVLFAKADNARLLEQTSAVDKNSFVWRYTEEFFWMWYSECKLKGGNDANTTETA